MANNKVEIDVNVDDKGTTKKVALGAKKVGEETDKASKSTDRFQRGLKGVGDQSANASKNFAKFSQGMGGFVAVYATLAAQIFAISAAFNFLKSAGELKSLEAGQVAYAGATGVAMKTLARDIQEATNAQIGFRDAAQAGAIGTAAGLSADQLTRLGAAAKDASQILGRDVTDSFNRLVRGVTKAEPELLDELGIILRLKDASQKYADAIGKNVNDLTQFEKSQAVANDVLGQAEAKYGRILAIVGDSPNEFAQLSSEFEELLNSVQKVAAAIAGPFVSVLKDAPAAGIAAFGLFLSGPLKAIGAQFGDMGGAVRAFADKQNKAFKEAKEASERAALSYDEQKKKLQQLATAQVKASKGSSESKILQKLKAGETLGGRDKAILQKALDAAKEQIKEFNEVKTGIFERADMEILDSFQTTMDNMEKDMGETMTKWQKWKNKGTQLTTSITSTLSSGMLRLGSMLTSLTVLTGRLAAAFLIFKTAVDFVVNTDYFQDRYGDQFSKIDEDARKAAEEMDRFKDRMVELSEQYSKLAAVQREIRREYDETGKAVINLDSALYGSAEALTKFFVTTFSPSNVTKMKEAIDDLSTDVSLIGLGKQFKDETSEIYGLIAYFATAPLALASMIVKGSAKEVVDAYMVVGDVIAEGMTFLYNSVADIEPLGMTKITTEISDGTMAMLKTMDIGKEAFDDFMADMKEAGGGGYAVFDEAAAAMARLDQAQKLLRSKEAQTDSELREQAVEMYTAAFNQIQGIVPEMNSLGASLQNVKQATEGAKQAWTAFSQSILKTTAAQKSIAGLKAQIQAIDDTRAKRIREGITAKDAEVKAEYEAYTLAQRQLVIAEAFNRQEVDHKMKMLSLQQESIRNYATILQGTEDILKKEDQINQENERRNFLQVKMQNAIRISIAENGKITDEVQQQVDLMDTQVDLSREKVGLMIEELILLKAIEPYKNSLEELKREETLLGAQKQQLDLKQKMLRLDAQRAQYQIRMVQMQSAARIQNVEQNMFRSDRGTAKKIAEEKLDAAIREAQIGIAAADKEMDMKIKQIDLEYDMLDIRREIQKNELDILANQIAFEASRKPGGPTQADLAQLGQIAALRQGLEESTFEMRAAAIQGAVDANNVTREGYYQAVLSAFTKLESQGIFQQFGQSFADSFESSLTNAIDTAFTSLYDDTIKLGDALRDIGRSFLSTIQTRVTEMFIVDPIMDALGDLFGEAEDPAEKVKAAILTALNDPEQGVEPSMKRGGIELKNYLETGGQAAGQILYDKLTQAMNDNASKLALPEKTPAIPLERLPGETAESFRQRQLDDIYKRMNEEATAQKTGVVENNSGVPYKDPQTPGPYAEVMKSNDFEKMFDILEKTGADSITANGHLLKNGQVVATSIDTTNQSVITSGDKVTSAVNAVEAAINQCMRPETTAPDASIVTTGNEASAMEVAGENAAVTAGAGVNKGFAKTMKTNTEGGFVQGVSDAFNRGTKYVQTAWNEMGIGMKTLFASGVASITAALAGGQGTRGVVTAILTSAVSAGFAHIMSTPSTTSAVTNTNTGGSGGPKLRYGGITRSYSEGGIAKGPASGYNATLHGNEAIVPLPNGNAIPVQMKGEGNQQNNVTVNVAIDGNGQAKSSAPQGNSALGNNLGGMIAQAVQKELQDQKRSGGILNPYGSA
jgi:hypothetical protein